MNTASYLGISNWRLPTTAQPDGQEDLAHAQGQLVEASARYRAAQKLKGKRSS